MNDLLHVMRPDGNLPVLRWLPPGGTGPGIVVVHEIFGLSRYVLERCAVLAQHGYVVYAPELYFRFGSMEFDESQPSYLMEGIGAASRLDWTQTVADTSATLDALRAANEVTGGVALLGFCFGGGVAFQVASRNAPDALVSFYGSALPRLLDLAPQVTCPSQHHFGEADAYIPMDLVDKIRTAVAPGKGAAGKGAVEFHTYAGAGHAFDNPHPMFHHATASGLAWRRTLDFLGRQLRPSN